MIQVNILENIFGYSYLVEGFSEAFRDDHLLPMAAAIWSSPAHTLMDYPAESFIRFCGNHGLLKLVGRPLWRTVEGGSHLGAAAQPLFAAAWAVGGLCRLESAWPALGAAADGELQRALARLQLCRADHAIAALA